MQENQLPTWCDLIPFDRHKLLGELIDAMIYNGIAVMEVQDLVSKFRKSGYVKSKILPNNTNAQNEN